MVTRSTIKFHWVHVTLYLKTQVELWSCQSFLGATVSRSRHSGVHYCVHWFVCVYGTQVWRCDEMWVESLPAPFQQLDFICLLHNLLIIKQSVGILVNTSLFTSWIWKDSASPNLKDINASKSKVRVVNISFSIQIKTIGTTESTWRSRGGCLSLNRHLGKVRMCKILWVSKMQ